MPVILKGACKLLCFLHIEFYSVRDFTDWSEALWLGDRHIDNRAFNPALVKAKGYW